MTEKQIDSFDAIIEENEKYLEMFGGFLEKRNYREKTVKKHKSHVDYYINHFLMYGIPKHMEEGCSAAVFGFIISRVNEKVIPASVHNIDYFLASIRLFYECMCEKKLVSRKQFKDFKEVIADLKDEMIEDYYDKHPKKIEVQDVVEAMEMGHDLGNAFMNILTGEVEYVSDFDDSSEEYDEAYDKIDGPDWVRIPEFRDYDIMTRFALRLDDEKKSEKLLDILHRRKAYRNFKDEIIEMGIENDYYEFHDQYLEQLAKEWIEEYIDESDDDLEF